ARTFFQAITSQVIDLPGGNVGKPQGPGPNLCSVVSMFAKVQKIALADCLHTLSLRPYRRASSMR
ncbi:hypothetical protein VDQ29_17085, partial [Xanthomonas campestris pv. campestris]|nr:hypothetical protein [Xanthomonas campestris pv. campestris]MEB1423523.1 hypothetical protein [Xanthomonas campestris pv. campestris]